jgi:hypothetical protein
VDVKNDYSGSYLEADYKIQVYNQLGADSPNGWIPKVVCGMKYKGYKHLKLLHQALGRYLELEEQKVLEQSRNPWRDRTD